MYVHVCRPPYPVRVVHAYACVYVFMYVLYINRPALTHYHICVSIVTHDHKRVSIVTHDHKRVSIVTHDHKCVSTVTHDHKRVSIVTSSSMLAPSAPDVPNMSQSSQYMPQKHVSTITQYLADSPSKYISIVTNKSAYAWVHLACPCLHAHPDSKCVSIAAQYASKHV